MVDVRMGYEKGLFHGVVIWENGFKDLYHFILINRKAAINEKGLAAVYENGGVASAGWLDKHKLGLLGQAHTAYAGIKSVAGKGAEHFGNFPNDIKGFVGGKTLLVKGLHGKVGINGKLAFGFRGKLDVGGKSLDQRTDKKCCCRNFFWRSHNPKAARDKCLSQVRESCQAVFCRL